MLNNEKRKNPYKEAGYFIDIGLRFAISIIVFLFLGIWIDDKTGLQPAFTIIGVFFGAGTGFYSLYRSLISHSKKKDEEK